MNAKIPLGSALSGIKFPLGSGAVSTTKSELTAKCVISPFPVVPAFWGCAQLRATARAFCQPSRSTSCAWSNPGKPLYPTDDTRVLWQSITLAAFHFLKYLDPSTLSKRLFLFKYKTCFCSVLIKWICLFFNYIWPQKWKTRWSFLWSNFSVPIQSVMLLRKNKTEVWREGGVFPTSWDESLCWIFALLIESGKQWEYRRRDVKVLVCLSWVHFLAT